VEWLKFLHVVTIIAAIGLAEGPILSIFLAARRRDVPALRTSIQAGLTGEKVANPLALLSIAFGIGAALVGQIDLTVPWLVTSYALLASAILMGLVGGFRHEERLKAAAETSPSDEPSDELLALLNSPWTGILAFAPPLIMGAVVFMMVVKPQLW
jgi:hypothetical protein